MTNSRDLERRVAALEARMDDVAADAQAARHLAAANDRDFADLGVKVEANRRVINALADQMNGRFDAVEGRLAAHDVRFDLLTDQMQQGFAEVRGALDGAAAGQQTIVAMLTRLIDDERPDRGA